ncbi:MAG: hypothetical protein KBD39_05760 [Sterolibacterium sp.]|nr:hypothetical protein [Sterolibacterium sp.]MBP9799608.1 hypothetical protein [Sterolibacterium sp.]
MILISSFFRFFDRIGSSSTSRDISGGYGDAAGVLPAGRLFRSSSGPPADGGT